jgi:hypothetical protein
MNIFKVEMRLVIYPLEKDNSLEFRFAWEVPLTEHQDSGMYMLIDAVIGEILMQWETFIC